jgi:hypothetical protein
MLREALVKVCYSLLFSTLQHFVKLPLSSNFRTKGDIQRATSLRPDKDETALAVLARIASDTLRSKCCDFVK